MMGASSGNKHSCGKRGTCQCDRNQGEPSGASQEPRCLLAHFCPSWLPSQAVGTQSPVMVPSASSCLPWCSLSLPRFTSRWAVSHPAFSEETYCQLYLPQNHAWGSVEKLPLAKCLVNVQPRVRLVLLSFGHKCPWLQVFWWG